MGGRSMLRPYFTLWRLQFTLSPMLVRLLHLALAAALAAYIAYFAAHAWAMLAHPFPLDYGEGPLLAQVELLRGGTPIWRLYGDPAQPPYAIVNYPPLYLLLTSGLSYAVGNPLLAGRLISLLATVGCVVALWQLSPRGRGWIALLFLTIPVVREWSVLMRVDMLGVCLGLWGCWLLSKVRHPAIPFLAGMLFVACLFSKPSLIAAPGAACLWVGWQAFRAPHEQRRQQWLQALSLYTTLAVGGGLLLLLLHQASDGWFLIHVVAANANRWEADLATGFWFQQLILRWGLFLAAALVLFNRSSEPGSWLLPCLYTLLGVVTAIGVGKVGAYSNYFLELYAGLIWLIAEGRGQAAGTSLYGSDAGNSSRLLPPASRLLPPASCLLVIASLAYYPPLWDAKRLRPAGLIEPSPPRFAFGSYGLWDDQRREGEILAALSRVNAMLSDTVRAAGPLLFTDMPGLAAQASVGSRLQVFEQRQLYDQGLATQTDLLHELANGELPLATIDYLGNWLTPEVVELLQRRYAQDGSLGTTDLYRPIAPGPFVALEQPLATSTEPLQLRGYHLVEPLSGAYEPGELISLTLVWQREQPATSSRHIPPEVVVTLRDQAGTNILTSAFTILYGAFPPEQWQPGRPLQHLQPFNLPDDLAPGTYMLSVALQEGLFSSTAVDLGSITVANSGGRLYPETGYFVAGLFQQALEAEGGIERVGLPLTPVVPFGWGRLQCYERACLELRGEEIVQRPLGEWLYLAETMRVEGCADGTSTVQPLPCAATKEINARFGEASIGPPISGEIDRNGYLVQWTRYARIERNPATGEIGLGRLGDDVQRLAPGMQYRWP
jgi:hypothetical protein